jgi:hypothetical protein
MTLPLAEVLHALGIAEGIDTVSILVERKVGTQTRHTLSEPQAVTAEWLQTMLFEGAVPPNEWVSMRDTSAAAPDWLREIDVPYLRRDAPPAPRALQPGSNR